LRKVEFIENFGSVRECATNTTTATQNMKMGLRNKGRVYL